ncbi:SseB family protein [Nonomuraea typhae]|uniref:SseB family protein n=1 Tax=Nonomuraea typhae TaxID=2603600 RepID=UPI0012FC7661|nr:SseB family protein [Nonomuraea typhae]
MRAASPFEEHLLHAYDRGDLTACLALLRFADFACPAGTQHKEPHEEDFVWPTVQAEGRTWIVVYTSAEALTSTGLPPSFVVVSLTELAARWPDLRWGLAVNPGLAAAFFLESGTVARLAVPTLEQDLAAEPDGGPPIVQKLLPPPDIQPLLDSERPRVSGYVHHALDVAHIATPSVLTDALLRDDALTDRGAVNILRWPAIGPGLYRTPYGGADETGRDAVAGWVVEEEPFVGMGLVPNVTQNIREYKVDGVGLPHGAEILELGADGEERLRAWYDADQGRWILTGRP